MSNLSIQNQLATVFQHYGRVLEVGATMVVRVNNADHTARRAASCLLEPMVGDKVLLSTDLDAGDYVLAVLERALDAQAVLNLPADTEIRATQGRIKFFSPLGIDLNTTGELSMQSTKLRVEALQGDVTVQNLSLAGDAWRSCIDRVKAVGRSLDSVFERCIAHVGRSYKTVAELDQVKAGQIDYTADTSLQLHAKYALVTAHELVKMDAEQIHLG